MLIDRHPPAHFTGVHARGVITSGMAGPPRGDSEDEGEHRLLVDCYLSTLEIGLARDVEQLLATQPSDLHALTAHLSGRKTRALLEQLPKQTHLRPHARGQHRAAVIRLTFYMPSSSTRMAATKYRRGPRCSCRTQQHVTKGWPGRDSRPGHRRSPGVCLQRVLVVPAVPGPATGGRELVGRARRERLAGIQASRGEARLVQPASVGVGPRSRASGR